jgi:VTC domain
VSFAWQGALHAANRAPVPLFEAPAMDGTTAQRYEIKFWATEEQAGELLRLSGQSLEVDPFCRMGPQRNVSLYLDSPARTFFEHHVAGVPSRFKLRVRTYDDPQGPAFLEVKHRFKSITLKRRVAVPRAAARDLVAGRLDAVAGLPPTPDLLEFLYLHQRYMAEPVLLVSARRLGLRSVDDGGRFRMTLDRDIRYQRHCGNDFTGRPAGWTPVDIVARNGNQALRVLVEAKFVDAAPGWLVPAVERLHLRPTSFSKYVAAMSQEMAENDGGVQMTDTRTDDEEGE